MAHVSGTLLKEVLTKRQDPRPHPSQRSQDARKCRKCRKHQAARALFSTLARMGDLRLGSLWFRAEAIAQNIPLSLLKQPPPSPKPDEQGSAGRVVELKRGERERETERERERLGVSMHGGLSKPAFWTASSWVLSYLGSPRRSPSFWNRTSGRFPGSGRAPEVFLDVDVDGELAAFKLGQAFVEAASLRCSAVFRGCLGVESSWTKKCFKWRVSCWRPLHMAMVQNPVPPVNIPIQPLNQVLKWVVHLPQNGTIGFDPQPYDGFPFDVLRFE